MESVSFSKPSNSKAKSSTSLKSGTDETKQSSSSEQDNKLSETSADEFSTFMRKALNAETKTQISEEELFSAIIEQRLFTKGADLSEAFRKSRDEFSSSLRKPDGFIPSEEVALRSLEKICRDGVISEKDAEKISGEAFAAAQLDGDTTTLYDSRGGPQDATIAVAATNEAIAKAKSAIEIVTKDASKVTPRPISSLATGTPGITPLADESSSIPPNDNSASSNVSGGRKLDGAGGFLWKPVSESDGKLAVLLPEELAGNISKVEVYSQMPADSSSLVDTSRYGGSHEGRPIFRFHKSGATMGDNVYLVVTKDDNSKVWWQIADGSIRND